MTPRSRTLSAVFGAAFGLMSVSNGFAMNARPLTMQTEHGIPFVSGGVSLDDRQTLRQMTTDDNLQLIFAAKKRDYLSDVTVQITDAKGHEVREYRRARSVVVYQAPRWDIHNQSHN